MSVGEGGGEGGREREREWERDVHNSEGDHPNVSARKSIENKAYLTLFLNVSAPPQDQC